MGYLRCDMRVMLSDCSTKTMTSGRLNEMLSTGISDMRLIEEGLAIKAKNRNVEERTGTVATFCQLILLVFCFARRDCKIVTRYHRDRFRSCEVAEGVGNVKCFQR